MKRAGLWLMMILFLLSGCSSSIHEIITSEPPGASIYWGKTSSSLKSTGLKTPNSRDISASTWEPWCYQVVMEGYQDSEVLCKREESERHVNIRLSPVETMITSDPPGAAIYWGPSSDKLRKTSYFTPHKANRAWEGANWKTWYFQVKKKDYRDSEIVLLPESKTNRQVNFILKAAD